MRASLVTKSHSFMELSSCFGQNTISKILNLLAYWYTLLNNRKNRFRRKQFIVNENPPWSKLRFDSQLSVSLSFLLRLFAGLDSGCQICLSLHTRVKLIIGLRKSKVTTEASMRTWSPFCTNPTTPRPLLTTPSTKDMGLKNSADFFLTSRWVLTLTFRDSPSAGAVTEVWHVLTHFPPIFTSQVPHSPFLHLYLISTPALSATAPKGSPLEACTTTGSIWSAWVSICEYRCKDPRVIHLCVRTQQVLW